MWNFDVCFSLCRLGQLSNEEFLKRIFQFIENDRSNEELQSTSIKFLLSFNLRFEYPEKNPLLLTLGNNSEELSSRTLIEQLIYLFNRNSRILICIHHYRIDFNHSR